MKVKKSASFGRIRGNVEATKEGERPCVIFTPSCWLYSQQTIYLDQQYGLMLDGRSVIFAERDRFEFRTADEARRLAYSCKNLATGRIDPNTQDLIPIDFSIITDDGII